VGGIDEGDEGDEGFVVDERRESRIFFTVESLVPFGLGLLFRLERKFGKIILKKILFYTNSMLILYSHVAYTSHIVVEGFVLAMMY
jgi:hypothetical protein